MKKIIWSIILLLLQSTKSYCSDTIYICLDKPTSQLQDIYVFFIDEELSTEMKEIYGKTQEIGIVYKNIHNLDSGARHISLQPTLPIETISLQSSVIFYHNIFDEYARRLFLNFKAQTGSDTSKIVEILFTKKGIAYADLRTEMLIFNEWASGIKWMSTFSTYEYVSEADIPEYLKGKLLVNLSQINSSEDFKKLKKEISGKHLIFIDKNNITEGKYTLRRVFLN